jgi:putative endonuclease
LADKLCLLSGGEAVGVLSIGEQGEDLVAQWLAQKGAKVLHRRWRQRLAEIDLIAQKVDGLLLFVEVKTRGWGNWDNNGLLAINRQKQAKILLGAQLFIGRNPELAECNCRFDVALVQHGFPSLERAPLQSILLESGEQLHLVRYLPAAFEINDC